MSTMRISSSISLSAMNSYRLDSMQVGVCLFTGRLLPGIIESFPSVQHRFFGIFRDLTSGYPPSWFSFPGVLCSYLVPVHLPRFGYKG